MNLLRNIEHTAMEAGKKIAFTSRSGSMSYEELWDRSGRIATWIENKYKGNKNPIIVHGHKEPEMIVLFLACTRSGRAYCPADSSMTEERILDMAEMTETPAILTTSDKIGDLDGKGSFEVVNIDQLIRETEGGKIIDRSFENTSEDIQYIIFTSGSTGRPKGVPISFGALNNYLDWITELAETEEGTIFLNQAPFSFDLSVMDLYSSLTTGSTLLCVDKELQQDPANLTDYILEGAPNKWVSTPSFAEIVLGSPEFKSENLPELDTFLFCGESLGTVTAARLKERFPDARVINTYGPTESTVCVTSVEITEDMLKMEALPIGRAKPGTEIRIVDEEGNQVSDGARGEMLIISNTLSNGYFRNPEKTEAAFVQVEDGHGVKVTAYRTGDEGYRGADGNLYYSGRIDRQIKFHGYRIELGDIEANLIRLEGIGQAIVVPAYRTDGKVRYLTAILTREDGSRGAESTYEERNAVRRGLKEFLPDYMVPKKIVFVDSIPLTDNGKVDRRKVAGLIKGRSMPERKRTAV